jgi:hypothetical protein
MRRWEGCEITRALHKSIDGRKPFDDLCVIVVLFAILYFGGHILWWWLK